MLEARRGIGQISSQCLQMEPTLPNLDFGLLASRSVRHTFPLLLFISSPFLPQSMVFYDSSQKGLSAKTYKQAGFQCP